MTTKPAIREDLEVCRAHFDHWQEAKDAAAAWAIAEKERRATFMSLVCGDSMNLEGAATGTFSDGVKFTVTYKQNASIAQADIHEAIEELPQSVSQALFKPEYKMVPSAYKKLDQEHRQIVDQYVTTKPALPSLAKK